jgi:hypothetical protein
VEEYGRARQATDGNITQRMRSACPVTKATDTHSQYVIIIAFPRQQWLSKRASMLRYTYITCIVVITYFMDIIGVNSTIFDFETSSSSKSSITGCYDSLPSLCLSAPAQIDSPSPASV